MDFGAGEPDFPTPDNIKIAAIDAINKNFTSKYLLQCWHAGAEAGHRRPPQTGLQNLSYALNECVVTVGGKHAIFNLMQALVEPGDEVAVIPVPYWVTYKDVVNYAGGKCVFVDTDENEGFDLRASMIEKALTPRTKMIIDQLALQSQRRVVCMERDRENLRDCERSRHLDSDRRVLSPVPLITDSAPVSDRVASGREGYGAGGRFRFPKTPTR